MRHAMLLIALTLAATAAQGQAMFRSVMPDGSIVYGDKPAPGAKEVKPVTLPAPNIVAPAQQSKPPAASRQPAADSADDQVRSAERELQQAKAALETGREPLPGERVGTAGGASRLTEDYFQRIKSLENSVAGAQKKLDDALAQRSGGR